MPSFNYVKALLDEPGQAHYLVDSNYRTVAQGWARADGTGPLDLWAARNPGYVYRTGDYATDALTMQAAIDAMVDFRADTLFLTPGNFAPATAVNFDVPDMIVTGPKKSNPVSNSAIITAGVASAFTVTAAADRSEFKYLQIIPLTAAIAFDLAAVSGVYFYSNFYNVDGITASTSTILVQVASAAEFLTFEKSYVWVDGAQGPWINCAGIMKGLTVKDFQIYVESGSWAAAIDLEGVGAVNVDVGFGSVSGGGTALTSLVTMADKTSATTHGYVHHVTCSTVGPATTSLAVAAAAAELDILNCQRAVATDTATVAGYDTGLPYTG